MPLVSTDDVQILFVEPQPPIVASSRTQPEKELRKAIAAVRRMADGLSIPLTATTVQLGAEPPVLVEELDGTQAWLRSSISPFGDKSLRERIERGARRTLAVGGISSEIAILRTVLDARELGYDVHLLIDCCGGLNARTEAAALEQMRIAGAVLSNVSSFFTSQVDDMASSAGASVMGALAELWSWKVDHGADSGSRHGIDLLLTEITDAWRAGDATRFAASFAANARFVAFDGTTLNGREAIAAYHSGPFSSYLAGTELLVNVDHVEPLADGFVCMSAHGGIVRNGTNAGALIGASAQTFVLVRRSNRMDVAVFHNTRIRPITSGAAAKVWRDFDGAWQELMITPQH